MRSLTTQRRIVAKVDQLMGWVEALGTRLELESLSFVRRLIVTDPLRDLM